MEDLGREIRENAAALGIVACAAALIGLVCRIFAGRGRLLPLQRIRRAPWQGSHVLVVFILWVLIAGIIFAAIQRTGFLSFIYSKEMAANRDREQLWSALIAFLLLLPGVLLLFSTLRIARPPDIGFTDARVLRNVLLGCLAWLPLTALTLGIHFLVLRFIKSEEPPFVNFVKKDMIPWEWALIAIEVLVIAPVFEEMVFRGLLQGWLVRAPRGGHYGVLLAALLWSGMYSAVPGGKETNLGPPIFAACLAAGYVLLIQQYAPPAIQPQDTPVRSVGMSSHPAPAIFGSAMLFATVHAVWPSPIPLFVLGLGLGWLAYRTQSLISSIVVHALFNAVALVVLISQS